MRNRQGDGDSFLLVGGNEIGNVERRLELWSKAPMHVALWGAIGDSGPRRSLSLDLIINLILEHCRLFLQLDQHLRPSLVGFSLSPHLEENIAQRSDGTTSSPNKRPDSDLMIM
jgi:hypothetical protein